MSVTVTQESMVELVEHAQEGSPEEVCGVLGGDREDDRVESVYRTENAAADPRTRYRIDPEELYGVLECIEDDGEEVVGFYHSHPEGPGDPSPTDEEAATWLDRVYLIVDCSEGASVSAWRCTDDGLDPEDLELW